MSNTGIRRWLWAFGASLGINVLLCVTLARLQATTPTREKVTFVEITVRRPAPPPSPVPLDPSPARPANASSGSAGPAAPSPMNPTQPAGTASAAPDSPGLPAPRNVATGVTLSSPIMTSNTSTFSVSGGYSGSTSAPPSASGAIGLGTVGEGIGGSSYSGAPGGTGGTGNSGYGSLPAPSRPATPPGGSGIRFAPRPTTPGFGIASTPDPTPPAPTPSPTPVAHGPSRPARAVSTPEPPYPPGAREDGIEGTVTLQVSLNAGGHVTEVSVAKSAGDRRLDQAAAQFVKARWRFEARMEDGQPVASTLRARVTFKLN